MKTQKMISDLLKETGWSYRKLAKELGVSKTTISRWHKGESKPRYMPYEKRLDNLLKRPQITNVTLDGVCVKDIPSEVKFDVSIFETIDEEIRYHEEELAKLKAQKEAEKWGFTEDEKVILRNLPEEYKWIARDKDGKIIIYQDKPRKGAVYEEWVVGSSDIELMYMFNHLFQCIQWSDSEPCEFRKYI